MNFFAKTFPVVCVGGSAGGLDAYITLLKHLPANMGVAIVIVNHMTSMSTRLHEVLPRYTKMPVELITKTYAFSRTTYSSSPRIATCTFWMESSV
jgi:two-component system, chemotaxis family, protein-glutamate methylesterase/glutaminase